MLTDFIGNLIEKNIISKIFETVYTPLLTIKGLKRIIIHVEILQGGMKKSPTEGMLHSNMYYVKP